MGNAWFGKSKTLEEELDDIKIDIRVADRGLERTKEDFEQQAQDLVVRAKEEYEKGEKDSALLYLKHAVRYRCACKNFTQIQLDLKSAELTTTLVGAQHAMQKSMLGVTRVLVRMNVAMPLKNTQDIMKRFQMEKYAMEMKQSVAQDTMDDSMSSYDNEEQQQELLKRLMDEIGMEVDLPPNKNTAAAAAVAGVPQDPEMDDLRNRIEKLKK